MLKKVLQLIPPESIGLLIGDREFIGHKWLIWLKHEQINFYVRVPKSHKIYRLDGQILNVEQIAENYPKGTYLVDCMVDGVWGNIYIKPLEGQEILFIFGTCKAKYLGQLYKKHWVIETCFQNLKSRGFNLEDTHLKVPARLSKLIAMLSIAYAFCLSLGIYKNRKVQKIDFKNHGYKANSFFRYGKDMIIDLFRIKKKIDQFIIPIFSVFARFILQKLKLFKYEFLVV